MKSLILAFALVLLAPIAHAQAAATDWNIKAATSWVGRADVCVVWSMTKAATQAVACTGSLVAPATTMVGPFTATELRAIPTGSLTGSGQWVCAHAKACPCSDTASSLCSAEVSGSQSFRFDPPILSIGP